MTYRHGVYASQVPTGLVPPTRVSAALPVVVGTAPVHTVPDGTGPVNKPVLVSNYSEAVSTLGYSDDWDNFTLCEFVKSHFALFAMAPIVFINVFDPAKHKSDVDDKVLSFDGDLLDLPHSGLIGAVVVESNSSTVYAEGTDFEVDLVAGKVTRLSDGAITSGGEVKVSYSYGDPEKVTEAEIIGGVDSGTGALTGLELVNEVYPRFNLIPGLIVSPKWSMKPAVAAVMTAKAKSINTLFRCHALIDLDDTVVTKYSDAVEEKKKNNLTDPVQILCWPKVKLGNETFHLSTQIAGLIAQVDGNNDDIPYASPSNQNLQMDSAVANGKEVWLQLDQANFLNGNGIVTALNWSGGWKCWGNRTACYPANTDPKDAFIPVGRMFSWVGNTLITTFWSRLDYPVTRRYIETILDSAQMWIDGLVSRQFLLGGRVEYQADENNVTDQMDGISRFHVYMTPPSPGREIDFIQEYDPKYFSTLFG